MAAARETNTNLDHEKKANTGSKEGETAERDAETVRQDLLVTEIESSDGHLGTTLRTVFDSGNDTKLFCERLDTRIKSHDQEIERMCNHHYQGFIESIRGLLQVRSDVENLKLEIKETNKNLQRTGGHLVSKGEELTKARRKQHNIATTIDTLTQCLPVLETYAKLKDQMRNKRYYPALKTLEQLEHTYLPRVSKYRFSSDMCDSVPKLRENIKTASNSDFTDFLENIRKHSARIGEIAMCHGAEQCNMDVTLARRKGKKRRAPAPPNPFTGEVETEPTNHRINPFDDDAIELGEDEGLSAQDLIDFSPVYRCLHIYTVLGDKEGFEKKFRQERRKQARLALQPPPNLERAKKSVISHGHDPIPHETFEGYKKYFHEIVGFFVVEDTILATTNGLVTRAYINEVWDISLSKVVAVLRTHIGHCTDASLMLQVKNLIMLFSHTLRGYGFTVSQLYDLLLEIRDHYGEILMKNWMEIFCKIFDEDNYTAITAMTPIEYQTTVDIYPYRDSALEAEPFPKRLPFSQFVPRIYCEVKEYIYACLKFTDDLHLSEAEIDDMIRKLTNVLLTRTLSGALSALIKRPTLSLLQLIQISINMNYLEKSCIYLEDFISNITGTQKDSAHVSKLQGMSMFKDARSEAEEQIYKQLNEKIDEFLGLSSYDWLMNESSGAASEYIRDLIDFLRCTFLSFTNLPVEDRLTIYEGPLTAHREKVAQTACMSACKHISSSMMDFLLDAEVKAISMGALQQFNLDLLQCEYFAMSEPVPGFNDGTLQLAFLELRQLVDLVTSYDWSTYLADFGNPCSKYLRVNPSSAINLLEKLKDADKRKNNLLTTFKRNERDRKKLLDTVLKQLRTLSTGAM